MRISKGRLLIIELFLFLILILQTSGIIFAVDEFEQVTKIGGEAVRYLKIAGSIFALAILAVYGIRWFMASAQEKATLKSQALIYIIGALLVFGGVYIAEKVIPVVVNLIYISPVK